MTKALVSPDGKVSSSLPWKIMLRLDGIVIVENRFRDHPEGMILRFDKYTYASIRIKG